MLKKCFKRAVADAAVCEDEVAVEAVNVEGGELVPGVGLDMGQVDVAEVDLSSSCLPPFWVELGSPGGVAPWGRRGPGGWRRESSSPSPLRWLPAKDRGGPLTAIAWLKLVPHL